MITTQTFIIQHRDYGFYYKSDKRHSHPPFPLTFLSKNRRSGLKTISAKNSKHLRPFNFELPRWAKEAGMRENVHTHTYERQNRADAVHHAVCAWIKAARHTALHTLRLFRLIESAACARFKLTAPAIFRGKMRKKKQTEAGPRDSGRKKKERYYLARISECMRNSTDYPRLKGSKNF